MPRRFALAVSLFCAFCLLGGCSKPGPDNGQVSGAVRRKGKPKSGFIVRLIPDPSKGNSLPINAWGTSDSDGKYELRWTYHCHEGLGAPVGWHRVIVEDTRFSGLKEGAPMPPRVIPPAFDSPSTTPLIVEVKPGPQTIDVDVK